MPTEISTIFGVFHTMVSSSEPDQNTFKPVNAIWWLRYCQPCLESFKTM